MTLPVEIFQSLQSDLKPAVLAPSTFAATLSHALSLTMQQTSGLDIVLRIG